MQAAYRAELPTTPSEGSAVWATESFRPSLDDFERFLPGFFNEPSRSMVQPPVGPVPAYSYGSAIFFKFLEERYHPLIIGEWLEELRRSTGSSWSEGLDLVLERRGERLRDVWNEFALWSFFTGERASSAPGFSDAERYPELLSRSLSPSFREPIRVFPVSIRPLDLGPPRLARAEVVFEPRDGDAPDALSAIWLSERGPGWSIDASGPARRLQLDWSGALRTAVLLVHGDADLDTVRPTLCVAGQCTDRGGPARPDAEGGCAALGASPTWFCAILAGLGMITSAIRGRRSVSRALRR